MTNKRPQRALALARVVAWLAAGIIVVGCHYSADRYHPDYDRYRQKIGTVLILPPEIGIFEELPDGRHMWRMDESQRAQTAAFGAVAELLKARNYMVKTSGSGSAVNPEILSIQALFRSVNRAIQLHTYGPQIYPAKLRDFDYEMGPVKGLLARYDADALVLVIGSQILSAEEPKTWLSIAVVEPEGRIIWYGMKGAKEALDLQGGDGTYALVHETLASFLGAES